MKPKPSRLLTGRGRPFALCLCVAALLAGARVATAATYTVMNLNDSGPGSLRDAVNQANANAGDDVIDFSVTGTITLTTGQLSVAANGKLTITGPGADLLAISGNNASRVLFVATGANAELSGLTIRGGNGTGATGTNGFGGGILVNTNGNLTMTAGVLTGNSASAGGGIFSLGNTRLSNVVVTDNDGTSGGGGIGGINGAIIVEDSVVHSNRGGTGGGISKNGSLTILNSTVRDNVASQSAGGISATGGVFIAKNSTISGNTGVGTGGGIENTREMFLTNVTVSNNRSISQGGGGIYNAAIATLTNCTVSNNTAAVNGGGLFSQGSTTVTLHNTVIANSTGGGDCRQNTTVTFSASHSLVEDGGCGVVNGVNNNRTGDPNLGPLADNGGATKTHALLPGSIAIDAGSNALAVDANNQPLTTDQRGAGFPRILGGVVDMGAYEAAPAGTVQFSSASYSVTEGAGTVTLEVTRMNGSAGAISVAYATGDGTTSDSDYTAQSGTLHWADGETTSKQIVVTILDDVVREGPENFSVTLNQPMGTSVGATAIATVTINDDDPAPTVQFSAAKYSVNENGASATLTVTKSGETALPSTVHYATSNGSATAGEDYTAASGDVMFAPNETSKEITVSITDDNAAEGNEDFTVSLSAPSGATLGNPETATVTIVDDDSAPVAASLSVSTEEDEPVTITLSASDADGDALSFMIVDPPTQGSLGTVSAANCMAGSCTATVDYTPANGYIGPDSFTYQAS